MIVNDPATKQAVEAAFRRYEAALVSNDVATLNELFWNHPATIRYGIGENLYGYEEIKAFRGARPAIDLQRSLERTVITTYGTEMATASTLFRRGPDRIGRQMQTWMLTPDGWRVVAAHVSLIPADGK